MTHIQAHAAPPSALPLFGPDPAEIRAIVAPFAPVSWAYLGLDRAGVDDRAGRIRDIRARLEQGGSGAGETDAIAEQLTAAPVGPLTMATFADEDALVRYSQLLDGVIDDQAGRSMPADVVPLIAADQDRPPFVSVVVDRAGADMTYSTGGAASEQHLTLTGPDDEIRHSAPGGHASLSESRFEHRAADSWQHNARYVADQVSTLAAKVGAQAVIVAGEQHMVGDLLDRLRVGSDTLVRTVSGSRAADRNQSQHREHVRSELHDVALCQTDRLLHLLGEYARDDLAAHGEDATVRALAARRVSTLLFVAGAARRSWFGAGAKEIYLGHREAARSVVPIRSAPLVHAAVRSALLSGARVRVVPAGALGGATMAALCRYGINP